VHRNTQAIADPRSANLYARPRYDGRFHGYRNPPSLTDSSVRFTPEPFRYLSTTPQDTASALGQQIRNPTRALVDCGPSPASLEFVDVVLRQAGTRREVPQVAAALRRLSQLASYGSFPKSAVADFQLRDRLPLHPVFQTSDLAVAPPFQCLGCGDEFGSRKSSRVSQCPRRPEGPPRKKRLHGVSPKMNRRTTEGCMNLSYKKRGRSHVV
jgi:hypothetical protein